MFGFAGSAADNGIHIAAGFCGDVADAHSGEDALCGIGASFAERHIVFFGAAFIAVADDLDSADVFARLEAFGIFFDGGLGIAADGGFIEIEVSESHLADGRIDAMFIFADFSGGAIFIHEAFRFGNASVVFAEMFRRAILGNSFRIAFGAASSVAAFLAGGAVNADFGVAVAVDALAGAAVADVAFVFFARAVLIVSALSAFGVEAVLIVRLFAHIRLAVVIFVALRIGRGAAVSQTNHKTGENCRQNTTSFKH